MNIIIDISVSYAYDVMANIPDYHDGNDVCNDTIDPFLKVLFVRE